MWCLATNGPTNTRNHDHRKCRFSCCHCPFAMIVRPFHPSFRFSTDSCLILEFNSSMDVFFTRTPSPSAILSAICWYGLVWEQPDQARPTESRRVGKILLPNPFQFRGKSETPVHSRNSELVRQPVDLARALEIKRCSLVAVWFDPGFVFLVALSL